MAQPVLYSYYRSSCSWRVRAALEYKGVAYDYKPVHLMKDGGEHFKEDFKKINPMAQVPAFITNGQTIIQSMAILEYIEETHPDPPLLPKDPLTRAKARAIAECITSGIQPLQNLALLKKLGDNIKPNWARDWIATGFHSVEELLQQYAGKYCVGDEMTFADVCLVPQVYNAVRFKVDLSPYPLIQRINATLMQHPAFIKSHPANQIDCPPGEGGGF
uniref:Uncharacterized protein n=1 Tax=Strigamia maritima TaxID=126957 RepID=T1J5X3_STRMM